jgi:hypothetical protein
MSPELPTSGASLTAVDRRLPDELPGSRPKLSDVQLAVLRCYGSEHSTSAAEGPVG